MTTSEKPMRTTRRRIRGMVELLRMQGVDIKLRWAHGRPRCYTADLTRELSPRLPMGQMKLWLEGFESGMRAPRYRVIAALMRPITRTPSSKD
jgi:hypothetical protein